MQVQMAVVYRVGGGYLVHSLLRAPDGYWVVRGPFERVGDPGLLGPSAVAALDRSAQLTVNPLASEAQDAELLQAAGFKSRKRFVEAAATCTLRRDVAGITVRGAVGKGSGWVPDRDAVEVDGSSTPELGEAIKSLLSRRPEGGVDVRLG